MRSPVRTRSATSTPPASSSSRSRTGAPCSPRTPTLARSWDATPLWPSRSSIRIRAASRWARQARCQHRAGRPGAEVLREVRGQPARRGRPRRWNGEARRSVRQADQDPAQRPRRGGCEQRRTTDAPTPDDRPAPGEQRRTAGCRQRHRWPGKRSGQQPGTERKRGAAHRGEQRREPTAADQQLAAEGRQRSVAGATTPESTPASQLGPGEPRERNPPPTNDRARRLGTTALIMYSSSEVQATVERRRHCAGQRRSGPPPDGRVPRTGQPVARLVPSAAQRLWPSTNAMASS